MITVGETAPDFTLAGIDPVSGERRDYTLSEYRGQPVVLVFYPGDSTPVCTRQLASYTDEFAAFDDAGATVLAISPQSVDSHEQFSRTEGGFAMPMLADEHKDVGRAFQILGPLGFYRRSAFVVDPDGIIRYAHRAVAGITFRSVTELVGAVRAAS